MQSRTVFIAPTEEELKDNPTELRNKKAAVQHPHAEVPENEPEAVSQEEINKAPLQKSVDIGQTPEYAASKLDRLVDKSYTILFRAKSIIWFDPFQDEITIDIHKVNIVFKDFMVSQRIHSVMIQNITDVFVDMTPFAATLRIVDKGFSDNTVDIKNLHKEDALQARRIIMGLIVAREQDVDLTKLEGQEILGKLIELGKSRTAE